MKLSEVYELAVKELPKKDIDHHASDLYLRKSDASDRIIERLKPNNLVSVFRDQIDHVLWYELPFCYMPWYTENKIGG